MTDGGAMTGESDEKQAVLEALWKIPGFEATRENEFTLARQVGEPAVAHSTPHHPVVLAHHLDT